MVFFVTFLRAIAACLITNSHYTGIYPTDLIANGGLLGNVIFFAVSGYCLYNIKYGLKPIEFAKWYGKRIYRVYPPVITITAFYMAIGMYNMRDHGFSWWFLFPTYYQFVASIITLYIPFFFIVKARWTRNNLLKTMIVIAVIWLMVYFIFYNKSYYHIDSVYEPMIHFLFMDSMLLGAWFRQNDEKLRHRNKPMYALATVIACAVYFASKTLFSRKESLASLQFLNQISIFTLLFCLFRTLCGLDEKLEKMPSWLKKTINSLSEMTLEIYVVQFPIIETIRGSSAPFPINWFILTISILLAAFILHKVCQLLYRILDNKIVKRKVVK